MVLPGHLAETGFNASRNSAAMTIELLSRVFLSVRFTRTAPMVLPFSGLIRIMELKSGTSASPEELCQFRTSGIRETISATSRTVRSVTSTGVPEGISTVTLKVFLLSFGRNPISTPNSGEGPPGPEGLTSCQKGIAKESAINRTRMRT